MLETVAVISNKTTFIEDLKLPCLENLECTDFTTTFQIRNSSKYDLFGIATAKSRNIFVEIQKSSQATKRVVTAAASSNFVRT